MPAGQLAEVDGQDALQLALVDGAGAKPAAHVGEDIVGVLQAIHDAALAQPFAVTARVAVVGQAGRNRYVGYAVAGGVPPFLA